MLTLKTLFRLFAAIIAASTIIATSAVVHAHEGRDVGEFNFVVGFREEPAYEGMLNAVSLIVTRTDDAQEMASMQSDEDDQAAQDDEMMVHGALFISPSMKRDETFEFDIGRELNGTVITYHVHPGDFEGEITVSDESSDVFSGTVMIRDEGMMPTKFNAKPGDTLTWVNNTNFAAVLMSGPVSAMSSVSDDDQHAGNMNMDHVAVAGPVSNLALQVEITHIPTAATMTLTLTEVPGDGGRYLAEFIPTAIGDYSFRIFGVVEGTTFDEIFESGPGTFDTVVAADAIQFPNVLESSREVENAARGALEAAREADVNASDASNAANLALLIAIVGVIFGLLGIGVGIYGILAARRPR